MGRGRGGSRRILFLVGCIFLCFFPPNAAANPVAMFSWTPPGPFVGEAITFNGDFSYDDAGGTIVDWTWTFGDGSSGTGNLFGKAYASPGAYEVVLRVRNNYGAESFTSRIITVREQTHPPLVAYEHPSGFRIPIPSGWDVVVDEVFEGAVLELSVSEPLPGPDGVPTNVLVDTDRDPSVRETETYLNTQIDFAIAELRRENPNAFIRDGPTHLRVANHSAVAITIGYSGETVVQRLVGVVSDPHDRYWILILTTSDAEFGLYGAMFQDILAGFVITLAVPALNPAVMAAGVGGVLAFVVVIVAVAVLTSRSRKARAARTGLPQLAGASPWRPASLVTTPAGRMAGTELPGMVCASCGTTAMSARDRFCIRCGAAFVTESCASCGALATDTSDRFCSNCGTPFRSSSASPESSPTTPPTPPAELTDPEGRMSP